MSKKNALGELRSDGVIIFCTCVVDVEFHSATSTASPCSDGGADSYTDDGRSFSRDAPSLDPRFSDRAEDIVQPQQNICTATGEPTDGAFIEAFNDRFRAEYLNIEGCLNLDDARTGLVDGSHDNGERRRGAIRQRAVIDSIDRDGATRPSSCQPVFMTEPEHSNRGWSKVRWGAKLTWL